MLEYCSLSHRRGRSFLFKPELINKKSVEHPHYQYRKNKEYVGVNDTVVFYEVWRRPKWHTASRVLVVFEVEKRW